MNRGRQKGPRGSFGRASRWRLVFAMAVAALAAPPAAAARTSVLHPLDGAVLRDQGGAVLGFCDDPEREKIHVVLNGESHVVELWEGVFEVDLDWRQGVNTVSVAGQSVTFISDPYAAAPREPSVHQAMLDACGNCHRLGRELDLSLKGDADVLCLGCHGAAVGRAAHRGTPCLSCHDPHGSWEPRLLLTAGNGLCGRCHETGGSGHTAHADIGEAMSCQECHDAHAPEPQEDAACVSCHGGHRSGITRHMDVACHTCHWMHGGGGRAPYKEPSQSCGGCHTLPQEAEHGDLVGECAQCHAFHQAGDTPGWTARACGPCHPSIDAHPDYHGPMPVTDCQACHPVHDPRNLSRVMARCEQCHGPDDLARAHPGPSPLPGDCGLCHRLHGDPQEHLLAPGAAAALLSRNCGQCHGLPPFRGGAALPGPWGELCLACHQDLRPALTHGPAREQRCEACHLAHGGEWEKRLRKGGTEGCLECHPRSLQAVSASRAAPGVLECTACHDPHGGVGPAHLRAAGKGLCTACHVDPARPTSGGTRKFVHGPVNTGECTVCHRPHDHGARRPSLGAIGELCRSCHENTGVGPAAGGHRPTAEGNCTACHDPHAAADPMLLRADGNRLCLTCHGTADHAHRLEVRGDRRYVSVPEARLDGERRLACLACHAPHGSTEPGLLVADRGSLCQFCH